MATYVLSDHHFGHENICKFTDSNGNKVRPWDDVNEMNEYIIKKHNEVVKKNDKCYFLGDVSMKKEHLHHINRLNGIKYLVQGNHDIFRANEYLKYFDDVMAYRVINKVIMSHIPINYESRSRFICNIHGHLHQNRVISKDNEVISWYQSACVELNEYIPVPIDHFIKRMEYEQLLINK